MVHTPRVQLTLRPRPLPVLPSGPPGAATGGRCRCGAHFVLDITGRLGGEALLDLLALLEDGDLDRALALQADVDYEFADLPYNPRTHSLDPGRPKRRFGLSKIFFIRRRSASPPARDP